MPWRLRRNKETSAEYVWGSSSQYIVPESEPEPNPQPVNLSQGSELEVIKSWLQDCDNNHVQTCGTEVPEGVTLPPPRWLIDVQRECIVEGERHHKYVALSYIPQTKASALWIQGFNLHHLQKVVALSGESTRSKLPPAILQAIEFTRLIGLRYLFAMQLCMARDHSQRYAGLEYICHIFKSAYVTLVAPGGGVNGARLTSATHLTLEKSYSQPPIPPRDAASKQYYFSRLLWESTWGGHGFSFPQQIYSRRMIIFFDNWFIWDCTQRIWSHPLATKEDALTLRRLRLIPDFPPMQGNTEVSWSYFVLYSALTSQYNSRKFNSECPWADLMYGFSALALGMSNSFQGGSLYGLPVACFDVALLWYTFYPERRFSTPDGLLPVHFPTWSWMGRESSIHNKSRFMVTSLSITDTYAYVLVTPLVKWCWLGGRDGEIEINPVSFKRLQLDMSGIVGEAVYEHYTAKHSSIAAAVPRECRCTKITCQTYRARFKRDSNGRGPLKLVSIRDDESSWAGILEPTSEDGEWATKSKVNEYCELIALSKGLLQGTVGFVDVLGEAHAVVGGPPIAAGYVFYNVMSIEWKEGIAYRKAVGRVKESAWDAAEKELIDVILG